MATGTYTRGKDAVEIDAVFILIRLTGKFIPKSKILLFLFVDPERVFDLVLNFLNSSFALRQKGVTEYLVNGAMPLHQGCKTAVSVNR